MASGNLLFDMAESEVLVHVFGWNEDHLSPGTMCHVLVD